MSAVNEILGNAGPRHTLVDDGRTYQLHYIDQRMKADLEKYLFDREVQAIVGMKAAYDQGQFIAKLDELAASYRNGEYAFESPKGIEFLKTPAGSLKLMALVLGGIEDMELFGLVAKHGDELNMKMKLIVQESLRTVEADGK